MKTLDPLAELARLRKSEEMRRRGQIGQESRKRNRREGRLNGANPETVEAKAEAEMTLYEIAEAEIRKQLKHRQPGMRRDAARLALELTKGRYSDSGDEPVTEIVFVTIPLLPEEFAPAPLPPPVL